MSEAGRITDEGVARLRARIGVPEPHPMPPHYREPEHRRVPQRRRSPTATTTRCGATPTTAPAPVGVDRSPRRCWSAATR